MHDFFFKNTFQFRSAFFKNTTKWTLNAIFLSLLHRAVMAIFLKLLRDEQEFLCWLYFKYLINNRHSNCFISDRLTLSTKASLLIIERYHTARKQDYKTQNLGKLLCLISSMSQPIRVFSTLISILLMELLWPSFPIICTFLLFICMEVKLGK